MCEAEGKRVELGFGQRGKNNDISRMEEIVVIGRFTSKQMIMVVMRNWTSIFFPYSRLFSPMLDTSQGMDRVAHRVEGRCGKAPPMIIVVGLVAPFLEILVGWIQCILRKVFGGSNFGVSSRSPLIVLV